MAAVPPKTVAESGAALRNDELATLLRLRVVVALGSLLWSCFIGFDALMVSVLYPGALEPCLWIRLGSVPVHVFILLLLYRTPRPSPLVLSLIDVGTFAFASVGMALLASHLGGIAGPYTPGVFLVLICRNASLLQPWRKSALSNAVILLAHFSTLLLAEWLRPGSVFTLGVRSSLALMALHLSSLSLGALILMVASQTMWAIRRRVFESRGLGRFKLVSRIAEGGHGEVWLAFDSAVRQQVAIKVLRVDMAEDAQAVARFELEIDALCRLRHPHTIRILDFGVSEDGVAYYAMELLRGCTLAELVASEGPLAPARVVHLILQASHALAEAHAHGIVHRDVKPENLFVLRSELALDFVKVLDFGIARHNAGSHGVSSLTRTGMVVGTPAFMAPEVAAGHAADARADVYGLGAVAYFLASGCLPASTAGERLRPPSHVLGSPLPTQLEALIMRCLSRDPGRRFADAAELASALFALPEAQGWLERKRQDAGALELVPTHPTRPLPSASNS